MSQLKSIGTKIQELDEAMRLGKIETSLWTGSFIESIAQQTQSGKTTTQLSDRQIEKVEEV